MGVVGVVVGVSRLASSAWALATVPEAVCVGADVGDGVVDGGNVVIFVGLGLVKRSEKGLVTRTKDSVRVGVGEGVGKVVGDGNG